MNVEEWLDNNQFSIDIFNKKYKYENETLDEWFDRVSGGDPDIRRLIVEKKFLFGGRVLANRGLPSTRKVSLSNCYVLAPPEDNIESIYDTAKHMARTFSYSGGVGTALDKIAPRGAKVNNAAKSSSGVVSFCKLYNTTGNVIGSDGRRAALMLSLSSEHPDIEEFIDAKVNVDDLNQCNMSVTASDIFMNEVDKKWPTHKTCFTRDTGEIIQRLIPPNQTFNKLVHNNWMTGEPGLVYMDRIRNWTMLSDHPDFEFAGLNPCGEMPLPAGGACCLGSINLAEYIKNKQFNFATFKQDVPIIVKAMNIVLDEGLPKHPLKEQQETVAKWRQIGVGICGFASALMRMEIKYGSDTSIRLASKIAKILLNESTKASAKLAKEFGPYPAYNYDYIEKSKFYQENIDLDVKELIKQYGLRNSQLLSIAPTGSISILLNISQSSEPIFKIAYNRDTQSLHGELVTYKIYDKTVEQIMHEHNITDEKDLPDYIVSTHEISYIDRIKMQAAWQQYVDASISSTINLPNTATEEDIYNLYIEAWRAGLKGTTVYRAGCAREGILTTERTPSASKELKRGEWKALASDAKGDEPIKLRTGCGKLELFPRWSESENCLQEVWLKKAGKGGCGRSLDAIAIEMSGILRLGGSLENVKKSFEGLEVCPSYASAKASGKKLSPGTSCADSILKALQKFEASKKKIADNSNEGIPTVMNVCPECGAELIATGGCWSCNICGYSKCE